MVWSRGVHLCNNPNAVFDKSIIRTLQLPAGIQIRRFMSNHLPLLKYFWGTHYCEGDWIFMPADSQISDWITDTNCRIWGASENDELVATLMLRRISEIPQTILSVDCICVKRGIRGKGYVSILIEHLLKQAYNMEWLVDQKPFTIIGVRESETKSFLSGIVPPMLTSTYVWANGLNTPVSKKKKNLNFRFPAGGVVIFNTWRVTFPSNEEQWEVCWCKGQVTLDELRNVIPSNIQVWCPNNQIPYKGEEGWTTSSYYSIFECWGQPPSLSLIPYMHF